MYCSIVTVIKMSGCFNSVRNGRDCLRVEIILVRAGFKGLLSAWLKKV